MNDAKVKAKIKQYTEAHCLSLPKVATAAGITYNRLYRMIYADYRITLDDYVKFCAAVNEPLDYFIK